MLATLAPNTPFKPGNGIGKVAHVPHALNPKAFRPDMPYDERPITVGYRGFRYPSGLGDDQRNTLVEAFIAEDDADVAFQVFPHPREYATWLSHCKSTIASEAGMLGMKAVSSRQFDSIGSRAALIMTRGEYSGCLDEDHYIVLEDDYSNKRACIERVEDEAEWQAVTDRALAHVMEHHTYAHRMAQLDELLWQ